MKPMVKAPGSKRVETIKSQSLRGQHLAEMEIAFRGAKEFWRIAPKEFWPAAATFF
jgi:hypothetical protein